MSKWATQVSWDDVPHLSDQAKASMLDSIPPAMRDARTRGVPQLGAGAIYPVPEDQILVEPFRVPYWFRHCYGMDVGWKRTAAVWAAIDPEADVVYLTGEYYGAQSEPPIHAMSINARGKWIPGVVDPAARGRSQIDGERLFKIYCDLGLNLTVADNSVEAGLVRVWQRLSSGRMKVFRNMLPNWLQEYRIYRRAEDKEGRSKIVKENDHAMDATRYLEMSGVAIAAQQPRENWQRLVSGDQPKKTVYNPFAEIERDRGGNDPYRMG